MKKYLKKYYKESICLFIILILSLLNIKKGYLLKSSYSAYFNKQLIWILIGLILYIFIYKLNFKKIFKIRYILYILNILLLIYVLLFSKNINGIKAWINIKGFTFQPSELTKITYPLAVVNLTKKRKYILPTLLFILPFTLILLEPDTGNAILLFLIYIYLLINKNNKSFIYTCMFIFFILILSLLFIFKYKPDILINLFNGKLYYRYKRIMEYKNNYQINNALIGIGNASLLPIKFNRILIYIPEGLTDFMFSFNICNFGILISLLLVFIYIYFSYLILNKYIKIKNIIHKKLIGSFLTIFIIQGIYNILMNIGLLPIMGIPLPFFSYGGSNIITYFIFYALITKKISSIEDKGNNNYKNNYRKVQMDNHSYIHKEELQKQV